MTNNFSSSSPAGQLNASAFAPSSDPKFDIGPLSWVMGEVREAILSAGKLLSDALLQDAETRSTMLLHAKSYLHQAHGALQIVDIDGVSIVTETIEDTLDRVQSGQLELTDASLEALNQAFHAILRYLEGLLSGGDHQPVRLFPYYRALLELKGAERIHPADLFFPSLSVQHAIPELALPANVPLANYAALRLAFERLLLTVLTSKDAAAQSTAVQRMHDVIYNIEQAQTNKQAKAFWLVMRGFAQAVAQGSIENQQYVKQIFARINLQIRRLVDGVSNIPERLLRDALFFIAQVEQPTPFIAQIRTAYQLSNQVPQDYDQKGFEQIGAGVLTTVKDQLSNAKNLWGRIANGDLRLSDKFAAKMKDLADTGEQLNSAPLSKLLRELSGIARHAAHAGDINVLGLEVATALLFVETSLDQINRLPAHFSDRADEISARLLSLVSGDMPQEQAAWMGEISREAQQRQTMAVLVGELQSSLRQVEKNLDEYFRDPSLKDKLTSVAPVLHQVGGALAILDQDDALRAVEHTRDLVKGFVESDGTEDVDLRAESFNNVAQNVGSLTFFIETLQSQPDEVKKKFAFDAKAKLLRSNLLEKSAEKELLPTGVLPNAPQPAADQPPAAFVTAEQELVVHQQESARLAASLAVAPADFALQAQLKDSLESQRSVAMLLDDTDAKARAKAAIALLDGFDLSDSAERLTDIVAAATPVVSAPIVHAPVEIPEGDEAIDAELLEIFLMEADEVLEFVGVTIPASKAEPSNQEHLTSLRRSFHTLKGSGRMVGLNVLGEAAWSIEQVMNVWLSESSGGTDSLYALLEKAASEMVEWVDDLKNIGTSRKNGLALIAAAQRMQDGGAYEYHEVIVEAAAPVVAAEPIEAAYAADSADSADAADLSIAASPVETDAVVESHSDSQVVTEIAAPVDAFVTDFVETVNDELDDNLNEKLGNSPHDSFSDSDNVALIESLAFGSNDHVTDYPADYLTDPSAEHSVEQMATPGQFSTEVPPAAAELSTLALDELVFAKPIPQNVTSVSTGDIASIEPLTSLASEEPSAGTEDEFNMLADSPFLDWLPENFARDNLAPQENASDSVDASSLDAVAENVGESVAETASLDEFEQLVAEEHAHDIAAHASLDAAVTVDTPPAELPSLADVIAELQESDVAEPEVEVGLMTVEGQDELAELLADKSYTALIEPASMLFAHDAAPEVSAEFAVEISHESAESAAPLDLIVNEDSELNDSVASPELTSFDSPEPLMEPTQIVAAEADLPIVEDVENEVNALAVLDTIEAVALFPANVATAQIIGFPEPVKAEPENDDSVKIIGGVEISVILHSIYMGETDQIVRFLSQDFAEWRHEPERIVSRQSVHGTHSLAGSSATVGLKPLHELAQSLEAVLQRLSRYPVELGDSEFDILDTALSAIKSMLHQFSVSEMPERVPQVLRVLEKLLEEVVTRSAVGDDEELFTQPAHKDDPVDQSESDELSIVGANVDANEPEVSLAELMQSAEDNAHTRADHAPESLPAQDEPEAVVVVPPKTELLSSFDPALQLQVRPVVSAPAEVNNATIGFESGAVAGDVEHRVRDDLDQDLLPIFIEEGTDLLPMVGELMRSWQSQPQDRSIPQSILRLMHTIKGSARMAGAMELGQHTHDLETRIETLMHTGGTVRQTLLEDLLARHDYSMQLFDRLQNPDAPQAQMPGAAPSVQTDTGTSLPDDQSAQDAAVPNLAQPVSLTPLMPIMGTAGLGFTPMPAATQAPAQAATPSAVPLVRVRADMLDRLVNQAGEVSISRSRLENEVSTLRTSLMELTDNVSRLRTQLREVEIQAETQITSRMALSGEREFDPLEFDRFTRLQELTRMMAETVSDVATVQTNLTRTLDGASNDLHIQARLTRELQQDLMRVRMISFASISERLYRVTRQTAKEVDKRVNLDIRGTSVEIDRSVLEKMAGPFEHLLRNAIVHGIETREQRRANGKQEIGEMLIEIRQEGNEVVIRFQDDGQGVNLRRVREKAMNAGLITSDQDISDAEVVNLIFEPGFSTASEITELAGRGVGMDVVRSEAASLGGRVEIRSEEGKGAHFTIHLPLTLAVTQVVILSSGGKTYAVPSVLVEQVQRLKAATLANAYNDGAVLWQGQRVPLFFLSGLLGDRDANPVTQHSAPVMILKSGSDRVAIHVDDIIGNREVVVKNIGPQLARMVGIAGATVLGSGEVVLILNPVPLAHRSDLEHLRHPQIAPAVVSEMGAVAETVAGNGTNKPADVEPVQGLRTQHIVMVVDDSLTVRRVTQRLLTREGYQVALAKDGIDALEQLQSITPDVMLVDIEMPRMDGFDLTRNIRGDARTAHIPIVMITSRTADKHRNYAQELGVNAYFGKPFREDDLLEAISQFVNKVPAV